ncbi:MAG: SH3 domain-containing protein [Chloroflexota bacterium]|nr:SH3 domain-containing protein [Chloroflexota bacterium]MDE2946781.1 SH3 domain-containing protein [Chloroflexota bacterium]
MPAGGNVIKGLCGARVWRRAWAALALCGLLAGCSLEALLPATATHTPTATQVPPTATPSATATATAPPTATMTFTATATSTPTATATATFTASPTPTVFAVVRSQRRVNIRGGPGTRFAAIGSLAPGSAVQVIGQNEEEDWYQVRLDDGGEGWMSATLLRLESAPPSPAAEPDGEAQRLSRETRIVVELGDAEMDAEAESEDGILVINLPIADVDAMQMTATRLVGANLTATAAAATPAPIEQASSPAPTLPAATPRFDVNVFAFCNDTAFGIPAPSDLTAGSTIKVYWAWFASTEAYLRQHMANATHELRIDGVSISDVDQFRLNPTRSGVQHVVYWYVPHGPLAAGPHVITYRVTWRNPISDGYASYGPGTDTEFEEESCNFTVS